MFDLRIWVQGSRFRVQICHFTFGVDCYLNRMISIVSVRTWGWLGWTGRLRFIFFESPFKNSLLRIFKWASIYSNWCKEPWVGLSQDPDLPSSQGSSRLSNRECSAVVLIPQESSPSTCMGLPQHSGILESSASCSALLPQFTHSKFTFSAMNSSLKLINNKNKVFF